MSTICHMRVLIWSIVGWVAIVPLAIANGALRQAVLAPRLGIRTAQPISGILLMLAIAAVAWLLIGCLGPQRHRTWVVIGAGWLLATLAFEFGMGLVAGRSWPEMQCRELRIDERIIFGRLLQTCHDTIGALSVRSLP